MCAVPWGRRGEGQLGECSVPWGFIINVEDILSTVGDIMSTVYHEYPQANSVDSYSNIANKFQYTE